MKKSSISPWLIVGLILASPIILFFMLIFLVLFFTLIVLVLSLFLIPFFYFGVDVPFENVQPIVHIGNSDCLKGSGKIISEIRDVPKFNGIKNNGVADLYLTQGNETPLVRVEGDDNFVGKLGTRVDENGVLIVGYEGLSCFFQNESLKVYVSMEEVKELSIVGSGNIFGEGKVVSEDLKLDVVGVGDINLDVDVKNLDVNLGGAGDVLLSGEALVLDYNGAGVGNLLAYSLLTRESNIEMDGIGDAKISVLDKLDADIKGIGNVYYKGNPPEVYVSESGMGEVYHKG